MSFVHKSIRLFHTLIHLKFFQVLYRVWYKIAPIRFLKKRTRSELQIQKLNFLQLPSPKKIIEINSDEIRVYTLNRSKIYDRQINWSENENGTLWRYQLQYCDFLRQDDLSVLQRAELVLNLYDWLYDGKTKPEPYPASLRVSNVIRFILEHDHDPHTKKELINAVFSELHFLENRIEYNILGNHLMENGFTLLMGGAFFNCQRWYQRGKKILQQQLSEQILPDGAHFERSPMYHLILLYRCLEASFYLTDDSALQELLEENSKKMLSWIRKMSFSDGRLAHFNDSTNGQSFELSTIERLAKECGIHTVTDLPLSESGFRRYSDKTFDFLIDVNGIAPSYQPGHAHADSLSFIFHYNQKPVITDPGTSVYYKDNKRRNWERSTKAHNTVTYREQNTADVWSQFRVGRRPNVQILKESNTHLELCLKHKLQSGEYFKHDRNIEFSPEFIEIIDIVNLENPVEGRLHLHPEIEIEELSENKVTFKNGIIIIFQNISKLEIFAYDFSEGFNLLKRSTGIEYSFIKQASIRLEVSKP